jgi:hypothetical protein
VEDVDKNPKWLVIYVSEREKNGETVRDGFEVCPLPFSQMLISPFILAPRCAVHVAGNSTDIQSTTCLPKIGR